MSEAKQAETQRAAEAEVQHLDSAIEATERRQSIRNNAAEQLGVPPTKVCELLRHVWTTSKDQPPLTDHEMFTGMSLIARYGLDPIAREVYVARDGKGRLLTIVGIDGWIKIVHRTDHYDGFEQEETFDKQGNVSCVETRIYSTRFSRPTTYRAYASEYGKLGGYVAKLVPLHMLRLFSFRHAARFFTPLGGVTTEEEARWIKQDGAPVEKPASGMAHLTEQLRRKAGEGEAKERSEKDNDPEDEATVPGNGHEEKDPAPGGEPESKPSVADESSIHLPSLEEVVAVYFEDARKAERIKDCESIKTNAVYDKILLTDNSALQSVRQACDDRAEDIRQGRKGKRNGGDGSEAGKLW